MPTNNKTESLYEVLARLQPKLERAEKSSKNPHYKSKYAGLDEFIEVARPVLNEEGCFLTHTLDFVPERTELKEDGTKVHYPRQDFCTCRIIRGEQEIKTQMPLLMGGRDDAQAFGSALTYARRYTLQALLCIATDEPDDDGVKAVGEKKVAAMASGRSNGKTPTSRRAAVEASADAFLKP